VNITNQTASSIGEYVEIIENFISPRKKENKELCFYFRGERDHGETNLMPSIYRKGLLAKEHILYHEIMRFNDSDFEKDKTTIDRLCRMQHFELYTRMLDLSEDCFTSLYFAVEKRKKPNETTFVYLFAIPKNKIRYYDSDTATILANLAKLPLNNEGRKIYGDKSKKWLVQNAKDIINSGMSVEKYNDKYLNFLLHEIRADKPYMQPFINLGDLFSVQCVKTKLNNDRILAQKGAFLLFGLNAHDVEKPIPLDGSYEKPNYWKDGFDWDGVQIEETLKIRIGSEISLDNLENLGISKPYIYPNMEKIAEHLVKKFGKTK
jgi:hypothetical protein